ncbi:tail fiber protein [Sporosarcina sp. A2]|uniref:tail fiber protein n=1 Tax=Sporosarcina sp. A2 TaxID=3393449 RepID=UPI003D7A4B44
MSWNVVRDVNALAEAIDTKAGALNGLATLGLDGKVPGSQLSISAPPDATTITKGVVKLNDSIDSLSITEAATANAVRKVAATVTTHEAESMPHRFTDATTGKQYRWGMGSENGKPYYIQEEVI